MSRRFWLILSILLILVILPVAAYAGVGTVVYNLISAIDIHCSERNYANATPEQFIMRADYEIDVTPYLITDPYQTVNFPARNSPDVNISAWYIPAVNAPQSAPTVIVVHGLTSCRREASLLMSASILHRAGFNVLLPDLNDHGDSDNVDGRFSAGIREHLDVLGGFDWLVAEADIDPNRIGVMGFSLGGGTAAIAFSQEPRLMALWTDASFADLEKTVAYELKQEYGLPAFLAGSAVMMGQAIDGVDISLYSPLEAFGSARTGRPVYLVHGTADERISVDFAYDLTAAVQATDPSFTPWLVEGAKHTESLFLYPTEYETRLVTFFSAALP